MWRRGRVRMENINDVSRRGVSLKTSTFLPGLMHTVYWIKQLGGCKTRKSSRTGNSMNGRLSPPLVCYRHNIGRKVKLQTVTENVPHPQQHICHFSPLVFRYLREFICLNETCLLEATCVFCLSLSKSVCLEVEIWPTTPAPLASLDPANIYSLSNIIRSSLLLLAVYSPSLFLSV